MRAYKTIKNTGIAVITEHGEFNDIHPKNKIPVGERLALQALFHVYKKTDTDAFGPIYHDCIRRGDKLELIFDHAENGFDIKDTADGFEVAGEDKVFHKAATEIKDDRIFVSADEVPVPEYARYAWTNYMEVRVFGKNGIPLAPFRTSMEDE